MDDGYEIETQVAIESNQQNDGDSQAMQQNRVTEGRGALCRARVDERIEHNLEGAPARPQIATRVFSDPNKNG